MSPPVKEVFEMLRLFGKDRLVKAKIRKIFYTAAIAGMCLLIPFPAGAIFGVGDVVFDPTSYGTLAHIWKQDISNYVKLTQTIAQLEKIYANGIQTYNLAHVMAQSFSGQNKWQWITVAQTAITDYTQDRYGENEAWSEAVGGVPSRVPKAWQQATVALDNGINLAGQTVGQSPTLARLASIEAMDGSSTKCLSTVAQYRGNSLSNVLGPVLKLAIARLDGSSQTNSEIQQLNIVAAEQEQGNNESRAQGQIDACLVEQQVLANKVQRDTFAENLNFESQYQQLVGAEGPQWGGAADALRSH
jgi:hypothetical protein